MTEEKTASTVKMTRRNRFITGMEATGMSYSPQGSVREQMRFLRRQFLQDGGLPFTDILSEEVVSQALKAIDGFFDRIYSPLVTLWVLPGQVLSADPSCRAAVARLIVHRISRKQKPCSAETGAYCQARQRLPEKYFSDAARQTGSALEANANEDWLWKGRRVLVYDGSTVSMPDTPEHQAAYPQPVAQKPGIGFPMARIAAVFSLACGAELDLRSLKETMQMDILRCKTPELVRKEIWKHILAYNLIRTIIAQAANKHDVKPRSISFKGVVQTLNAFQPLIACQGEHDSAFRMYLYKQILDAIATHHVADRPDRFEPRKKKRRPKPYDRLMKSRHEAKRDILKGFTEN